MVIHTIYCYGPFYHAFVTYIMPVYIYYAHMNVATITTVYIWAGRHSQYYYTVSISCALGRSSDQYKTLRTNQPDPLNLRVFHVHLHTDMRSEITFESVVPFPGSLLAHMHFLHCARNSGINSMMKFAWCMLMLRDSFK